jgi:hypothetical protein
MYYFLIVLFYLLFLTTLKINDVFTFSKKSVLSDFIIEEQEVALYSGLYCKSL